MWNWFKWLDWELNPTLITIQGNVAVHPLTWRTFLSVFLSTSSRCHGLALPYDNSTSYIWRTFLSVFSSTSSRCHGLALPYDNSTSYIYITICNFHLLRTCILFVPFMVSSYLSRIVTKPTKWHVHPAKTQISLGICPVWSQADQSLRCPHEESLGH